MLAITEQEPRSMKDKRLRPRLRVSMPIQVIGRLTDGEKFREICQTQDASSFGLSFKIASVVERGTILYLSMRMPQKLRLYDIAKDLYQIYAQVQHIKEIAEGVFEIGVCFLGKTPPPGYENYQTVEFTQTPLKQTNLSGISGKRSAPESQQSVAAIVMPVAASPAPKPPPEPTVADTEASDVRRDTRHAIPMVAGIEYLDPAGNSESQEQGLVLNISKHGACVMSMSEAVSGTRVRLTIACEDFIVRAVVKHVTVGSGGVRNLHIEFLDKCWMGGA